MGIRAAGLVEGEKGGEDILEVKFWVLHIILHVLTNFDAIVVQYLIIYTRAQYLSNHYLVGIHFLTQTNPSATKIIPACYQSKLPCFLTATNLHPIIEYENGLYPQISLNIIVSPAKSLI